MTECIDTLTSIPFEMAVGSYKESMLGAVELVLCVSIPQPRSSSFREYQLILGLNMDHLYASNLYVIPKMRYKSLNEHKV